jgi:hypothetical protein
MPFGVGGSHVLTFMVIFGPLLEVTIVAPSEESQSVGDPERVGEPERKAAKRFVADPFEEGALIFTGASFWL